jgi:hypothetical protein
MTRSTLGQVCMGLAVAGAVTFAASDAAAIEIGTPAQQHPYRSAQNFALELRFSPYYPAVDDEPGLNGTPFKDRFGENARLAIGLEFDWQILRIPYVGTIGPGLGASIVGMSRPGVTKTTNRASGDEYSLDIYPFYLSAVLRADAFWRDAGIPLVPYAKLGFGYGLWRASNSLGTSNAGGSKGRGGSLGTHVAIGLAFALDALDSGASRNMDNAVGINNTYFYAEYYWLNLNGLAQENALYVGTNTYAMGLAFEF